MELTNEFVVPVPPDVAWGFLLDVERVADCMPGAQLTGREGDQYKGHVKVKLGPMALSYSGTARFESVDDAARRVVIQASGKESRGAGTARATVVCKLHEGDGGTTVRVSTDLQVTGKPAQFGRGLMADVTGRLIDQFAASLADQILAGQRGSRELSAEPAGEGPTAGTPADTGPSSARPPAVQRPPQPTDHLDLLATAGVPILKRIIPLVGVVTVAALIYRRVSKHV